MNASEHVKNEGQRLKLLIDHWCPPTCTEEFPISLMRAFMGVTACAAEQARMLEGKQVVRPLHSFPDPAFGFDFSTDKQLGLSSPPRTDEDLAKIYNPVQIISTMLKALPTDEARHQAIEGICKGCGALDPRCQCQNDD